MRIIPIIITLLLTLFWVRVVFAVSGPTQLSPTDGSTVSSSTVSWQAPSYTLYSSSPYRVQVDDDSSFGSINKDYYTANTTYTPSLSDGTWYWRVKAKDDSAIWSDWSSIWSFILNTTPTPTPSPTPTSTPIPSPSPSPTTSSSDTSTFTITQVPSEINSDQVFTISANLSLPSNPNTTFYLKGAFKKSDSSNYFGQTKVSGSWVKNSSSYSSQYSITTDGSGNWSGNLEVQVDSFDSGYIGEGDYIFKVARYSSSGSGPTWSNEQTIKINVAETSFNDEEIGVINLSKASSSPKSQVLGQSTNTPQASENSYSLEKYLKVATPTSKTPPATPSAEVKGTKQINFLSIIGSILVIIGITIPGYAIYHQFRKRNQETG